MTGHWKIKSYVLESLFSDAKCGKIQCHSAATKPKGTNAVSIDTTIKTGGTEVKCRGTYVYSTQDGQGDLPDPGLVMTGTKCGEGKVGSDQAGILWSGKYWLKTWKLDTYCMLKLPCGWGPFQIGQMWHAWSRHQRITGSWSVVLLLRCQACTHLSPPRVPEAQNNSRISCLV